MGARALVLGALLLAACSSEGSNPGNTYAIYSYNCCVELSGQTIWHAGDHLTLHWRSETRQVPDRTAHLVSLRLTLTGPFQTVDSLKQVISQKQVPRGLHSIQAATLAVTDRSGGAPASQLDLPPDLAPGFYNLGSIIAEGNYQGSGGIIIQVQ
jgi:hypothetical protein